MTLPDLPNDSHIVRYVRPSHVREDGSIDGENFRLRPQETALSVNWLDYFQRRSKEEQLGEVRRIIRLSVRSNGRFAELNVGTMKTHIAHMIDDLRFIHSPREATARYRADPSHSEIIGLPPGDSPHAALIGEMIAECVGAIHLAVT